MGLPSLVVGRHGRSLANIAARRSVGLPKTSTAPGVTGRRLFSDKPDTKPPPTAQNVALAAVLFGFCGAVFTYSLNQVGRSQEGSDPLAQLKAEAQEARAEKDKHRKLTPEEVAALESGMTGGEHSGDIEVAIAAPAEIAQIEEEASLKVFRQKQGGEELKKKKLWWRFGF
jgi:hypothetical protein